MKNNDMPSSGGSTKDRKKILIFSLAYYPDHVGGAEVAIKEITDRLTDIDFHMVTLRYDDKLPREEKIGNVLVHRIGLTRENPSMEDLKKMPLHLNKHLFQITAAFKAMKLHKKYKYDGIWAMMAHSCGIPAGIFKTFNKDVKYSLTLQEGDPPEHIERLMKPVWPLFSRAFTLADRIQPISSFLADWAKRRGFKGNLEVIPNGFNTAVFTVEQDKDEVAKLKNSLGKKEDEKYLVTVSRLVHKNAIDDCIKAMKFLDDNIKFVIVGGGPDEDMLKTLAKEEGVQERCIFIGQVDRTPTALYRKVSDIFVRPSRSEGMGNSFVSTMVAKIPIITTQEGGIKDFLFDEKRNPDKDPTGWAVDKDSPEQIAKAVKDILARPEQVEKVVNNAYNLAFTKYNWDNIAKDIKDKIL